MQPPAHPLSPRWLSLSGQAVLVPLQLGTLSVSRVPYGQFLLAAAGAAAGAGPPWRACGRWLTERAVKRCICFIIHSLRERADTLVRGRFGHSSVPLSLARSLAGASILISGGVGILLLYSVLLAE